MGPIGRQILGRMREFYWQTGKKASAIYLGSEIFAELMAECDPGRVTVRAQGPPEFNGWPVLEVVGDPEHINVA